MMHRSALLWMATLLLLLICCHETTATVLRSRRQLCNGVCVDRSQKNIAAFYHGNVNDPFWQQVQLAAVQAGRDHGVSFNTTLYNSFNPTKMAQDILDAASDSNNVVDALIVSIPNAEVEAAVQQVIGRGIPVFGVNSGYGSSDDGLRNLAAPFIGQDEYKAGAMAANRFLQARRSNNNNETNVNVTKAIFVNHEPGNDSLQRRFDGFRDTLLKEYASANVTQVEVDVSTAFSIVNVGKDLSPMLQQCNVDFVLSAGVWAAQRTLRLVQSANNQCNATVTTTNDGNEHYYTPTLFGTFDKNRDILKAIDSYEVLFAISQQRHLQAVVPVVLASLYVTTGKLLIDSSTQNGLTTGPVMVDAATRAANEFLHTCAHKGFDGPSCRPREEVRVGTLVQKDTGMIGVAPGKADTLLVSIDQALSDLGVAVDFVFEDADKLSQVIQQMCQEGQVDGLLVLLSSTTIVADAFEYCQEQNIQILGLEVDGEVDANDLNSVGSLSSLSIDMAKRYTKGYLSISLLTYFAESGQAFQNGFKIEPAAETSPLSLFASTCSGVTPPQMCEDVPATNNNEAQQNDDENSAPVSDEYEPRSTADLILLVLFVLCGLVGVAIVLHYGPRFVHRMKLVLGNSDEEDEDTVVSVEEEPYVKKIEEGGEVCEGNDGEGSDGSIDKDTTEANSSSREETQ